MNLIWEKGNRKDVEKLILKMMYTTVSAHVFFHTEAAAPIERFIKVVVLRAIAAARCYRYLADFARAPSVLEGRNELGACRRATFP